MDKFNNTKWLHVPTNKRFRIYEISYGTGNAIDMFYNQDGFLTSVTELDTADYKQVK